MLKYLGDANEGSTGLTACPISEEVRHFQAAHLARSHFFPPQDPENHHPAQKKHTATTERPKATPQTLSHAAEIAEPRGFADLGASKSLLVGAKKGILTAAHAHRGFRIAVYSHPRL